MDAKPPQAIHASLDKPGQHEGPALSLRTVAAAQRQSNAPAPPLHFLATINECIGASPLPHPVIARNAGLVPAWQRWTEWQEGAGANDSVADRIIANPRNHFEKCVNLVKKALRSDPIWGHGVVAPPDEQDLDMSAVFAAAPLMYLRRPHALIELTPALQRLLASSDLGADIPVGLLRPPMPACFIKFGADMQTARAEGCGEARVEGVYVLESVRETQRAVALVTIWTVQGQAAFSASTITLIAGDERESLVDVIERNCAKNPDRALGLHLPIAQLCTKVFLYWNVEQARRETHAPYSEALLQLKRLGPKKAAKSRRHVDKLYDKILLGPLTLPGHAHGAHDAVSPHWRRGHFRMQSHGPQHSLRKVIFIAPMLIRADLLEDDGDPPSASCATEKN
ncbi:hypothetical protein [Massilia glaciei]|uniref:Uncharacterized protein n=1 Tax=Massilia glaciei TaxID=1524097 RepID=A0A2U2HGW7_9BURK|nr:hypothetical protein [Massilia glaciei]PWF44385.1 hypothetical protein C7C56_019290 [Massilia glaciei]